MKFSQEIIEDKSEFIGELTELIHEASFENVFFAGAPVISDLGIKITPHPRLAITFEGCHQMLIEDRGKVLTINPVRGDATFMPTGCWNYNTGVPFRRVVTFMFFPDRTQFNFVTYSGEEKAETLLQTYSISRPLCNLGQSIIATLTELGKQEKRLPQASFLVKSLLFTVLDELNEENIEKRGRSDLTWEMVNSYLSASFPNPITRESVAKNFHITPNYLSNLCKKKTGQNFNAYLSTLRINHAKQLLAFYDHPVGTIGSLCGFDDTSYFCAIFKRYAGLSPLKFRAQSRQKR